MDKKISQLTAAATLTGTELLPIVQGGQTVQTTAQDIADLGGAPYLVYTALLTQSGGDNQEYISEGSLLKGVTYLFDEALAEEWDFSNLGGPKFPNAFSFVSTEDGNPNSWGAGLIYNAGAPVVKVLENTIGNIWWTYGGIGYYIANSTNLFGINKTTVFLEPSSNLIANGFFEMNDKTINTVEITFSQNTSGTSDNALKNTAIEIRVYP